MSTSILSDLLCGIKAGSVLIIFGLLLAPSLLRGQEASPTPPQTPPKEPNRFLMLGLTLTPSMGGVDNAWVINEGQDYSIVGALHAGYEVGMAHRYYDNRHDMRFKTFFNLKYLIPMTESLGFYLGAGGGLFQRWKVTADESQFRFNFGFQGIVGVNFGPPYKHKFCLEVHFINSPDENEGMYLNVLVGARF